MTDADLVRHLTATRDHAARMMTLAKTPGERMAWQEYGRQVAAHLAELERPPRVRPPVYERPQ